MTHTDELIEKVARAICVAQNLNPDCLHQNYGDGKYPNDAVLINDKTAHFGWRRHEKQARAALSTLGLLDGTNMLIPNWRDISEAEKDGTAILARLGNGEVFRVQWVDGGWLAASDIGFVNPQHFIPLSSIPTPEDGE